MSKITSFCLAATLLTVATPAAFAEGTKNVSYSCVPSGEEVKLMVSAGEQRGQERFVWKNSIFEDKSSELCQKAVKNLTKALTNIGEEEKYFYFRVVNNNVCLATTEDQCDRIVFKFEPKQIEAVQQYLFDNYDQGGTEARGFLNGSFPIPIWPSFR
ncbi:MAG: hypothetical protein F6K47_07355 [Symploca sp. SIO2E6]|nr:hypothetical protein [Symploca sp. SIO2E6]